MVIVRLLIHSGMWLFERLAERGGTMCVFCVCGYICDMCVCAVCVCVLFFYRDSNVAVGGPARVVLVVMRALLLYCTLAGFSSAWVGLCVGAGESCRRTPRSANNRKTSPPPTPGHRFFRKLDGTILPCNTST